MTLEIAPGSTVSHFRLEKKVGEGGMGAVWLAEDLTLSRRVAIKFMNRALVAQQASPAVREQLEKRFIREAKSAASINHPNICQIYEATFEAESWFIAMELISGNSLGELLEQGRKFSADEAAEIVRQTIAGLRHAWLDYKIIHRDIKPQNLMLSQSGLVKIVDMGLAKPIAAADEGGHKMEVTMAGAQLGTPQYMAPEQAVGELNLDLRADIYSLGVTLYELLTGAKTFTDPSAPLIYVAQLPRKYKPILELAPETPENLVELVELMLEPKADTRINDYDEVLELLGDSGGVDLAGIMGNGTVNTSARRGVGATQGVGAARSLSATRGVSATRGLGTSRMGTTRMGGTTAVLKRSSLDYYPNDYMIIGRYHVIKPLGKTRAGVVHDCLDTDLGVECAVISIMPRREFPPAAMPQIIANYRALLNFNHPNLPQIRDLRLDDSTGELFVVMGLLNGMNLREFAQRKGTDGRFELKRMLPVLELVAEALDGVAAATGAPHCDLKPESIFLTDDEKSVRLLDYGVTNSTPFGKPLPEGEKPGDDFLLASPEYMAPEFWLKAKPTPASDQYSLAVIVYELLTRRLPFWLRDPSELHDAEGNTRSEEQLLERLKERVLRSEPSLEASLPMPMRTIILQAMNRDPAKRYAKCADFVKALKGASGWMRWLVHRW